MSELVPVVYNATFTKCVRSADGGLPNIFTQFELIDDGFAEHMDLAFSSTKGHNQASMLFQGFNYIHQ